MSMASLSVDEKEQWRKDLLVQLLEEKGRIEGEQFKDYQSAIESSSWVKKCLVKVNLGGKSGRWEQVNLELEQHGTKGGQVDFGTLSMFGLKTSFKEHISLSEITCISVCSEKCSPQIAIFTARRSSKMRPILMKFVSEMEMNDWHGELLQGMNSVHGTFARPSPSSVFSVTARGEVMVFDPEAAGKRGEEQNTTIGRQYSQEIEVDGLAPPFSKRLDNGFGAGSSLYWEIRINDTCTTFAINLQFGDGVDPDTSLHFNPRLTANHIVLNSKDDAGWGNEEKQPLIVMTGEGTAVRAFSQGSTVQLVIKAENEKYEIFVNGVKFATFKYRKGLLGGGVSHVRIVGDVVPLKLIYSSKSVILPPPEMYWRSLGGGHLLMVESCPVGVVWGLGYDSTAWVYSGGWGGHPSCKSGSSYGVGNMSDMKYFYIYENQRWNPVTGFSATGLPTDRHMWSDKNGLHQATKESVRLPGGGWVWAGDWMVDHHTPGGTDKDGWQFATDFPASYHSSQTFTDYVRRRRWARKCRFTASGPWTELGTTKLLDVSLQPYKSVEETVRCWAVATNGEALYRIGVASQTPEGEGWSHVRSDNLFQAVTVGGDGNVWLVSSEGHVYLRHGVDDNCPGGQIWVQVQNPESNSKFRSVEGGSGGSVWALDTHSKLWLRRGISVQYPEGTSWTLVSAGVRSMSHGMDDLWTVLEEYQGVSGVLVRRGGVTPSTPCGDGWEVGIGGGWRHVSVRGWIK